MTRPVHPDIGVARVGNADPSRFFIGPEAPGQGPVFDKDRLHIEPLVAGPALHLRVERPPGAG